MKTPLLLSLVCIYSLLALSSGAAEKNKQGKSTDVSVVAQDELTDATFALAYEPDFYLVKFYSPTCGHCKALAPNWVKVVDALEGVVSVGQLDVTKHREATKDYGVKYVPHIVLFKNKEASEADQVVEFQGRPTIPTLIKFVLNHLPTFKIKSEQVESFLTMHYELPRRVLLLHSETPDRYLATAYSKIHRDMKENFIFGEAVLSSQETTQCIEKLGLKSLPALIISAPAAEKRALYKGSYSDASEMRNFLERLGEQQEHVIQEQEPHLSHGTFTIIFVVVCFLGIVGCVLIQRKNSAPSIGKDL